MENELSDNQKQFVKDAEKQGFEVTSYSGRGMYGNTCPSIVVTGFGQFKTDASIKSDNMGLDVVLYAQY